MTIAPASKNLKLTYVYAILDHFINSVSNREPAAQFVLLLQ